MAIDQKHPIRKNPYLDSIQNHWDPQKDL